MIETYMESKIKISNKAKVLVEWRGVSSDLTKMNEDKIRSYFAKKYNIPKSSIRTKFINISDKSGSVSRVSDNIIDDIMDINYQRDLIKTWFDIKSIEVELDRVFKLDDSVNTEISSISEDIRFRNWKLKKVSFDNFLSFGEDQVFNYEQHGGVSIVSSNPSNQGGKTVFAIDLLLFLFFNTTTKSKKAIELFNKYTDKNTIEVSGIIEIDGEDYGIDRRVKRTKKKSGTGYSVSQKVEFYKINFDGTKGEILNDADRVKTDAVIKSKIGTMEDFLLTIISTADNLESLFETKPTKRLEIFNKFIGLDLLAKKEETARKMYNNWSSNAIFKNYKVSDINDDIDSLIEKIAENHKNIDISNNELQTVKNKIKEVEELSYVTLSKKHEISPELEKIKEDKLLLEIDSITDKGLDKKKDKDKIESEISAIEDIIYDESRHNGVIIEIADLKAEKRQNQLKIKNLEKLNDELKNSEVCPMCQRSLDSVDHSEHIKQNIIEIYQNQNTVKETNKKLPILESELASHIQSKSTVNTKYSLELKKSKLELELDRCRNMLLDRKRILKEYKKNLENINNNIEIDKLVLEYKTKINRLSTSKDTLIRQIQKCESDVSRCDEKIIINRDLLSRIIKESKVDEIFKHYIKCVGKNGISTLVLGTVIPIVNDKLKNLLDDVCDFNFYLEDNDKNEVQFIIEKDNEKRLIGSGSGFEKTITSIALKCVLTKISIIPKPDLIIFDEVLGKVSETNLEKVRILFERIRNEFDSIFVITHNGLIRDWADNIIEITKIDNISKISLN